MNPDDHASPPSDEGQEPAQPSRVVMATTDPGIADGWGNNPAWEAPPDQSVVADTSGVTQTAPAQRLQPGPSVELKPAGSRDQHGDQKAKGDQHDGRNAQSSRPAWVGPVMTAALALACGVIGAWAFSRFDSSKDQGQAKQAKGGDDPDKQGVSSKGQANGRGGEGSSGDAGPDAAKSAPSDDGDAMKGRMEQMSMRFATLQQRVNALATPRDTNPPDLSALRVRVGDLSRSVDDVASLPERLRRIEDRLDRLQDQIKGMGVPPSAGESKGAAAAPKAVTADLKREISALPSPPSNLAGDPNSPDDAMASGVALFKEGQYARADEAFRKLQASRPKDARVWYFSALAHGFATGHWDGETRTFVVEGADRERAGLPPAPQIDSAFAGLSPAQGKDWLASYRSQLVKR